MKNLCFRINFLGFAIFFLLSNQLKSQEYWVIDKSQINQIDNTPITTYSFNNIIFKNQFNRISKTSILLPNENEELEKFVINEIQLLSNEMSLKHPLIKTYKGYSAKRSNLKLRLTTSPLGVSAWINIPGEDDIFIQPLKNNLGKHILYRRTEKVNKNWICETVSEFNPKSRSKKSNLQNERSPINNDQILRTFRIAIATTGEYTIYWDDDNDENGNAQQDALAAIVSTMNRVNSVYETDLGITMQLVSGTEIIYTDPETDPFTGNYNSEVQIDLTTNIGEENYDIGHLFAFGSNNGSAGCIGCICVNGSKGSGFTSHGFANSNLGFLNDWFDIDYVAHEIGHQFGATHTFAFNVEGTGTNVEPGSGSTIMGYAGITGPDDVQPHSDPYFNYKSIEDITEYIATQSCYTSSEITNNPPVANAGVNYTIPKGTAYELVGSATDLDSSDQLTYCWEQIDSGLMTYTQFGPDNYSASTARSLPPTSNPKRSIPNLNSVLNGELIQTNPTSGSAWETVSNISRELNWGLTVRDRDPLSTGLGGQSSTDSMTLSVISGAGPFKLTSQSENGIIWRTGDLVIIEWSVANTNLSPINTSEVSISMSLDSGQNFDYNIVSSTLNDGVYEYIVPNGISESVSENVRLKIQPTNSIYYTVNDVKFSIEERSFAISYDNYSIDLCEPSDEIIDFDVNVYTSISDPISIELINLPNGVDGSFNQNTFNSTFLNGQLTLTGLSSLPVGSNEISIQAQSGNVSAIFPLKIKKYTEMNFSNDTPILLNPSNGNQEVEEFNFQWEINPNVSTYTFQITQDEFWDTLTHEIQTENNYVNIELLDPDKTYYWRVRAENSCDQYILSDTFTFKTAQISYNNYVANDLPVDLNDAQGQQSPGFTNATIFISDVNSISEIEVLVNLTHTWVSDLTLTLIAPDGSSYTLADGVGLDGDNFTNTIFSSNAQNSINSGSPPFTGSFRPNQPFDPLIGISSFGNWTLKIKDNYPFDSGELIDFQLKLTIKGEILMNSDLDSFPDINDNCPEITNENQSDGDSDGEGDICDFDDQSNFQILKYDESCRNKNNGRISVSAFADFNYSYSLTGPNGFNNQGTFINSTGVDFNNLQSGSYTLCVNSNNGEDLERCFTAVVNEPESLQVSSLVNYDNSELRLVLNGGSSYKVNLNGREYNFHDLDIVKLPLKRGINQFTVITDLDCQGSYSENIYIGEKAYVSPNPVNNEANIFVDYNTKKLTIDFYSMEGGYLKSAKINLNDTKTFKWAMGDFPSGIYFMKIKSNKRTETIKIVKR
tara:strand:- start:1407 stop:5267 length:3861 start_codon:yes stop_codon:yes gene_type:complete